MEKIALSPNSRKVKVGIFIFFLEEDILFIFSIFKVRIFISKKCQAPITTKRSSPYDPTHVFAISEMWPSFWRYHIRSRSCIILWLLTIIPWYIIQFYHGSKGVITQAQVLVMRASIPWPLWNVHSRSWHTVESRKSSVRNIIQIKYEVSIYDQDTDLSYICIRRYDIGSKSSYIRRLWTTIV